MTKLKSLWSLALAAAVITAGCGDSKSSMNPVAPSAVVADAQNVEDGANDAVSGPTGKGGNGNGNGNGNGGDNDNGNGNGKGPGNGNGNGNQPTVPSVPTPPTNTSPTTPGKKVEIEGLIAAKGGDTIIVNAQTVVVPSTCVIRHGSTTFSFGELRVGDRVHVKAARNTTGTGATATSSLVATEVKLQNPGGGEGDDEEEPTSLVSVSATDALASETAGNTGAFRLTRTGDATLLAAPLAVTYTLTGAATNGTDYQNIPLTANFVANQTFVDVLVTPLADGTTEGSESVILTLTGVAPYELGSPLTATVTISDTDNPLVSVTAFDSTASEAGPDMGTFRFARTGSTAGSLTVTFTVSGTASNGVDYQNVPLTVTFSAGQATSDLFILPLSDGSPEAPETVIVTVSDGATYDVGAPDAATVTITG